MGSVRVEWVRLGSNALPGGDIVVGTAETDVTSGSAVNTAAAPTFPADGSINANSGKARVTALTGAVIVALSGVASATNGERIEQGLSQEFPVVAGQTLSLLAVAAGSGAPTTVSLASAGEGNVASFNRTADTNAYAANDVVGPATGSSAAQAFTIGPAAGGEVIINSAKLQIGASAIPSGMTSFGLALYSVTPPSAYGDNAAWDEASGDRASYLGTISLGAPVDIGSTLEVSTDGIDHQITTPAGGVVYGYLITNGAFTPASATAFAVALHAVAL